MGMLIVTVGSLHSVCMDWNTTPQSVNTGGDPALGVNSARGWIRALQLALLPWTAPQATQGSRERAELPGWASEDSGLGEVEGSRGSKRSPNGMHSVSGMCRLERVCWCQHRSFVQAHLKPRSLGEKRSSALWGEADEALSP